MNDADLYRKFEEYFTNKGWTFAQAADALNVARSSLFNWKRGKPISARARLAMRTLVAEAENAAAAEPRHDNDTTVELQLLAAWLRELPQGDLTKVIALVAELRAANSGQG